MKRLVAASGALALAALLTLMLLGRGSGGSSAAAQSAVGGLPTAGVSFEPVLGIPASEVHVLGASPAEGKGEAWAYGALGNAPAIVAGGAYADQLILLEHTEASGWQVVPLPQQSDGEPLSQTADETFPGSLGSLGGRVTPAGGVVLLTSGGIVVRDPGGMPELIAEPTAGEAANGPASEEGGAQAEVLFKDESLPPVAPPPGVATAFAAIDEADGRTGVLIAPYDDGAEGSSGSDGSGSGHGGSGSSTETGPGVLHYDGKAWTREPIEWHGSKQEDLTPQALACGGSSSGESSSSPQNCWLLASYRAGGAAEANRLALFRRSAGKQDWERVAVADWMLGEQAPPSGISGSPSVHTLGSQAQTLTVTSQGVWVDFQAKINGPGSPADVSELVSTPPEGAGASVAGTWCYPTVTGVCERTLAAPLPAQYRSFAVAGSSSAGPSSGDGTRIITGLPSGAMLELDDGELEYAVGAGGSGGAAAGAALSLSPQGAVEQGWIGEGGADGGQGQSPLVDVTPQPQGDQLQQTPVPFRHPLLAVTQAPGTVTGAPNAEAIAVGVGGEIGRYVPGTGWSSESLYSASGEAQTPTLRGVAWPEPGRAYAVGDKGAMWVWRAQTGLWEPDPAAPYNFIGNLTGIAFSPSDPGVGYAVGKQGVLLKFGKSWEQVSLPAQLQQVDFTSIAFAGEEAFATYRAVVEDPRDRETAETGGLAVEDGSGWQVDASAAKLLAQLPDVRDAVLSKVAGLPDGGAVAAGPGLVIERENAGSEWRFSPQPLPEAENVSALAAYREADGPVRAVVSVDLDEALNPNLGGLFTNAFKGDLPPPSGPGQPPPYLPPDPLPSTGYLLRETSSGWVDMEHMALEEIGGNEPADNPLRPDPVLALMLDPSGSEGLAVGGQTGDIGGASNGSRLDPTPRLQVAIIPRRSPSRRAKRPSPLVAAPPVSIPAPPTRTRDWPPTCYWNTLYKQRAKSPRARPAACAPSSTPAIGCCREPRGWNPKHSDASSSGMPPCSAAADRCRCTPHPPKN
jgi:hypothetical protein